MKQIQYLVCSGLCLLALVSSVRADFSLLEYDTTNPNGASGAPSPDLDAAFSQYVTALKLSRGAGVNPNQGIAFNSSNWLLSDTLDLNSDKFIQWGWSSASQKVDLTSMTIQYDVSPSGPSQLAIAVGINGQPFVPIFMDGFVDPSDETHTLDLTMFDNVDQAVFRLFGFDSSSPGGTLDIEEIVAGGARGILIRGDFSTVPEPSSIVWLAVLLLSRPRRRVC